MSLPWRASLRGADPALLVVGAGVVAALHVGKLPPAIPVLSSELGVTLIQAGFMLSLVQLGGMLLGLVVGLGADAMGLKRSMITGLLVLTGASCLGAFAREVDSLLVLRAIEGFGFLLVSMPAPGLIRQLVAPRRLSAMLGLWGAYMPLGTALALLTGPFVIDLINWRAWWLGLAVLSVLAAAWVWKVVPPDWTRRSGASGPKAPSAGWGARLLQTLGSAGPWLVALTFSMYSGQWLAVIGFLPSIYAAAGFSGASIALLTALVAAVNMIGNIASGRLLGRGVAAQHLLFAGFFFMGLGTVLAFVGWPLSTAGAELPASVRLLGVLMFSMIGGMIPGTLFSLAVRLAPGEGTISTTVGWMQQWAAFGQFAGPPVVAWVASQAGGWHWTWVFTVGCCVAGALLAVQLGRRSRA